MDVELRLRRVGRRRIGRRKLPVYSLVATDSRSPRNGRFIEDLGRYQPQVEPAEVSLKTDRILYWLMEGAQPSGNVRSILSKEGVLLRLRLSRKGEGAEEIERAVEAHRSLVEHRVAALAAERDDAETEAFARAARRATRAAHMAALQSNSSVLIAEGDDLYRVHPDGSRDPVGDVSPGDST